jgi:hypothetical protein
VAPDYAFAVVAVAQDCNPAITLVPLFGSLAASPALPRR